MNQTNADGLGIASVKKTAFEITAHPLFPEGANEADYVTVICDADGQILDTQGIMPKSSPPTGAARILCKSISVTVCNI